MAEASTTAPELIEGQEPRETGRSVRSIITSTELDLRLFGMIAALLIIWLGFHIMSGGTFFTPRNLWFLTVQTAVVAIMATGMVLIIVTRNIDLSVGSVLGFVGVFIALLQTEWLPRTLGLGFDHPATWLVSLVVALVLGGLIGAFHGVIVAYVGVPAFIVTLGGLLVWRGGAWALASGRTIAPMDSTFQILGGGGGLRGAVGETVTWGIGIIACIGIVVALIYGRRRRRKYGFPLRPIAAEVAIAVMGSAFILAGIYMINQYFLPVNLARRYAEANGIAWPEGGLQIPIGIANPVLIAIVMALLMTYIAQRLRFGRFVFAIGGNPEAAVLAGINTRRTIVKTFALMGVLVGLAAAVSTARLNAATSGLGTLSELYVIAAAVIGGTSLAGGIGTIPGAILGALVMQSLQSGMVLMGVDAPIQDIVVGIVLVMAVAIDSLYRRRLA